MTTCSVVIPVKDGERYLEELLCAVAREAVDETLVIDSGSRDRSVQIARAAGVELLEIDPNSFGHGRTRNLGADRTTGEFICFLTQDATPVDGWLDSYREAFSLAEHVGAAFGPHLPRQGASPMIARELSEFFATFSPDGAPVVHGTGGPSFLSNVNACYARACWEQVRFRDVPYAEDQAFGVDMLAAGWRKVYHSGAAVLHSHDYGFADFMRRYFDEYRALRDTTGHIEPFSVRAATGELRRAVRADLQWMRERQLSGRDRLRWTASAAAHHGGRRAFSALGSRAERLPAPVARRLSLERRPESPQATPAVPAPALHGRPASPPSGRTVTPKRDHEPYERIGALWRDGRVLPIPTPPGTADRERLRIAMIIPAFSRGSGGHNTLFQIYARLEQRGHVCSVWVHDYLDALRDLRAGVLRHDIREFFAPIQGPVYKGFDEWHGADVVIATGWQTVHPTLLLDRSHARVYVVNDHEPDFYPVSAESAVAEDTYRYGLHCVAASGWLRDMLIDRYGVTADAFQLGVDHEVYRPRPVARRRDMVAYYARPETPRRAVPIGLMALAELQRRRPDIRIVMFGTERPIETSFSYEHMGIINPVQLSWLYSEATVGLSLSLTNFSLAPKEMMACGLPCVELAGISAESIFGSDGPISLAPRDPVALADALEVLLRDPQLWERRSRAGLEFVASHTWDRATDEVEAGLRHALRLAEQSTPRREDVEALPGD